MLRARYEGEARNLVLTLAPRAGRDGRVRLDLANVWGRGDWTLAADGSQILSGNAHGPGAAAGAVTAKRDGDLLVLDCLLRAPADFVMTFH